MKAKREKNKIMDFQEYKTFTTYRAEMIFAINTNMEFTLPAKLVKL